MDDLDEQFRLLEEESSALFSDLLSFVGTSETEQPQSKPQPKPQVQSQPQSQTIPVKTETPIKTPVVTQQPVQQPIVKQPVQQPKELSKEEIEQAEEAMRLMEEQSNQFLNEMEEEEKAEKAEQAKIMEENLRDSLQHIMAHAQEIEDERNRAKENARIQRQQELLRIREIYYPQVQQQTQEFIVALKNLVEATDALVPGAYIQSTASIVTCANGFIEIADNILSDTRYDPDIKPDIKKSSDLILERIKSLVDATKTAARDHPSQVAVSNMKSEAMELAKNVKIFASHTKV